MSKSSVIEINVIKPSVQVVYHFDPAKAGEAMGKHIEKVGRICYLSEGKITDSSWESFIVNRILGVKVPHLAVLEAVDVTVVFTTTRDVTHEIVRHRIGSYWQESQRWVNYDNRGFTFIAPEEFDIVPGKYIYDKEKGFAGGKDLSEYVGNSERFNSALIWLHGRVDDVYEYLHFLERYGRPELARQCLPNCTKTVIGVKYNLRTWRHVFMKRALNPAAQPSTRALFKMVYDQFAKDIPWALTNMSDVDE